MRGSTCCHNFTKQALTIHSSNIMDNDTNATAHRAIIDNNKNNQQATNHAIVIIALSRTKSTSNTIIIPIPTDSQV